MDRAFAPSSRRRSLANPQRGMDNSFGVDTSPPTVTSRAAEWADTINPRLLNFETGRRWSSRWTTEPTTPSRLPPLAYMYQSLHSPAPPNTTLLAGTPIGLYDRRDRATPDTIGTGVEDYDYDTDASITDCSERSADRCRSPETVPYDEQTGSEFDDSDHEGVSDDGDGDGDLVTGAPAAGAQPAHSPQPRGTTAPSSPANATLPPRAAAGEVIKYSKTALAPFIKAARNVNKAPFACPVQVCQDAADKPRLVRHVEFVHLKEDDKPVCEHCDQAFSRPDSLARHLPKCWMARRKGVVVAPPNKRVKREQDAADSKVKGTEKTRARKMAKGRKTGDDGRKQ